MAKTINKLKRGQDFFFFPVVLQTARIFLLCVECLCFLFVSWETSEWFYALQDVR